MDSQLTTLALYALGAAAAVTSVSKVRTRLQLSKAKHRSLGGHSRLARRIAALVPSYAYQEERIFRVDNAPDEIALRRQTAFERLAQLYKTRFAKTVALTDEVAGSASDLQFTSAYRVPFQFSPFIRRYLKGGAFFKASSGVMLTDIDGNRFYDAAGSYGVNVLGYDFYKDAMADAARAVGELGPVLGALHPVVAENVRHLKEISGLDEVSFHMSGTEAVMQAVRLARYHTQRRRLVRFCGAYHGWSGDVQPGIGNPVPPPDTFTLSDMSPKTLAVLRKRRDIACILVNPLQALHPNISPPADSALVDSGPVAQFDKEAYAAWLRELRAVCTERRIVLIFDEVFTGFRLARGGAQEYFGVKADLVTYGKTVAGGWPIGVVCGRADLMKRFRDERPLDVCLARGTFNSHPYVMAGMAEFFRRLDSQGAASLYEGLDATWNARAAQLNRRLEGASLPVRVANLSSIWTVNHLAPSRYNWMLQFYLRAEGLALSWVGTGRLIFSLNYSEADFDAVADRFVAAATAMRNDGWWWHPSGATNRSIRRGMLREIVAHRLSWT